LQNVEKPFEASPSIVKHRKIPENIASKSGRMNAPNTFGCVTRRFDAHVGELFAHTGILAGGGRHGQADRTCRLSYCTNAPVQGISASTASSVRARRLMRIDITCCEAATVWAWSEKS